MPDLSPEEREALEAIWREPRPLNMRSVDTLVSLVQAALTAVPRLAGDRLAEALQQRDAAVAIAREAVDAMTELLTGEVPAPDLDDLRARLAQIGGKDA